MDKVSTYILISALFLGFFAAAPVKADQVFLFSDDLTLRSNIDIGQTSAKFSSGRVYTADDSVSSAVASDVVANPSKLIMGARLDVSVSVPSDAMIVYYLSNFNGGSFGSVAYGTDINSFLCNALASLGLGCGSGTPGAYQPGSAGSGSVLGSVFGGSTPVSAPVTDTATTVTQDNPSGGSALTAAIYTAGKKQEGSDSVNLVRIKGQEEIYEIVGGKKHLLPTMDIFFDYGLKLEVVQDITQKQLDKFSRIKLMQMTGDKKKTFYFTEGGMIRLIPDKNVFNSYGDREEDVIVISKKEFNWYPQNQFVFLENPLNRDVYQLVNGKVKRYLTKAAVKRMKIDAEQIAPINQVELANYQTDKPIVL